MIKPKTQVKHWGKFLSLAALTHKGCIGIAALIALLSSACGGSAGGDASVLADAYQANSPIQGNRGDENAARNDPNHLNLALKYVSYVDDAEKPIVEPGEVKEIVYVMNKLYSVCNVSFIVEEYLAATPKDYGLDLHPNSMGQLNGIRSQFQDSTRLVVINTGSWDSAGGLGADGANAWTMMPGNAPFGAVIESTVATTGNLIAHEVGHYLDLDHVSDPSNMMSPLIYGQSTGITKGQCQTVREAALNFWPAMLR
jgi:hypothetical protein